MTRKSHLASAASARRGDPGRPGGIRAARGSGLARLDSPAVGARRPDLRTPCHNYDGAPSAGGPSTDRAATEHGPQGPRAVSWFRSVDQQGHLARQVRAASGGALDPIEDNSAT